MRVRPGLSVRAVIICLISASICLLCTFTDAMAAIELSATPIREADAKQTSRFVIDNSFVDPYNNCEICTRMVYTPGPQEEAGIAYKDDKLDLMSSQRVVFFAKGQSNEQITFVAAGNNSGLMSTNDTDIFPRINFSVVTDNVTLKNNWQRFEIGLNGTELSDATYPFGFQLSSSSPKEQVIYIKGVTLDDQPVQNPLPTVVNLLNSTSINSTLTIASVNSTNMSAQIEANSTNIPAQALWILQLMQLAGWRHIRSNG